MRALEKARAVMDARPRCGAKRKRDGEPCQRPALLPSKRCRLHGAPTPRGDDWHRIRKPAKGEHRGLERFEAKLAAKEKLDRKRAQRLAVMTPEQRERHERWQSTHQPGARSVRERKRQERATAKMLGGIFARADTKITHAAPAHTDPLAQATLNGRSATASLQLAYEILLESAPTVLAEHAKRLKGDGYPKPTNGEFAKLAAPFYKALQELGIEVEDIDPEQMTAEQLERYLPILQAEIERIESGMAARAKLISSVAAQDDEVDVFG